MILNTPDTPYKGIVCNQEICTKKSYNSQKIYRSGIGSLLYLVKHSQPELSNVVRKISKCMDKQNMSHYKDLIRVIKYTMDKKYYCYQMKPDRNINGPWELRGYSDVVYAGDNVTSKIITGYIVLINGAIITCHFQIQKTVTLSVIEAEYSEITELCCKILFVRAILLFMGAVVE